MSDDSDLLRRHAAARDEAAFGEFVRRTVDFVHGAALRQCRGDAALAQDLVQATEFRNQAGHLVRSVIAHV